MCLSVFMSVCLFVSVYVYLSVFLSAFMSVFMSVCLSVLMFVFLFVCVYVFLSVFMLHLSDVAQSTLRRQQLTSSIQKILEKQISVKNVSHFCCLPSKVTGNRLRPWLLFDLPKCPSIVETAFDCWNGHQMKNATLADVNARAH